MARGTGLHQGCDTEVGGGRRLGGVRAGAKSRSGWSGASAAVIPAGLSPRPVRNVFIDSRYLRKPHNDPAEAGKLEEFLNSIPEQDKQISRNDDRMARLLEAMVPGAKVDVTTTAHGFIIDQHGNVGCWSTTIGSG